MGVSSSYGPSTTCRSPIQRDNSTNSDFELTSGGDFLQWRDQSRFLAGIAAFTGSEAYTLQLSERPERLRGAGNGSDRRVVSCLRVASWHSSVI